MVSFLFLKLKKKGGEKMKKVLSILIGLVVTFVFPGIVSAVVNDITPSTNDINRTKGWAHVDLISQGVETVELQFISTRNF